MKLYRGVLYHRVRRGPHVLYKYMSGQEGILFNLCKFLDIVENQAQFLCLKYPVVKKLNEEKLQNIIVTLDQLGFDKSVLLKEPLLFSLLPITLNYRFQVLNECGIENVSPAHLVSYFQITKEKTIGNLRQSGYIKAYTNVENRLASYMTQWPTSLTTLIFEDINKSTLQMLRLKILQRYFELVLDLTEDEFYRGIKTYPTIKNRPLKAINETLTILQSQIMIPNQKIKTNLYLVQSDPENLKQLIYTCKSIGGIDIKEVIRLHPKIATRNCSILMKTKDLLYEYGFDNESLTKCFDLFTLGPETIKERLEIAKSVPEFSALMKHPRFLKVIYHNKIAMQRLRALYSDDKKCLSLNALSSSNAHYEIFKKSPGDRSGKGKDLIFTISQSLENKYSQNDIRKSIKRHPFWINIPVIQAKLVYERLSSEFSTKDIYDNLPILFYPWNRVREVLNLLNKKPSPRHVNIVHECLDISKCSKSQKLSLTLYILEKNHYFSGNGVWSVEKYSLLESPDLKELSIASSVQ